MVAVILGSNLDELGVREKDPTLRIGLNLAEMLKQSGAKVYITRKQIQMLLHSLQPMWKNCKRV